MTRAKDAIKTVELKHDPQTPLEKPLVWQKTGKGAWRSQDGEYLITTLAPVPGDHELDGRPLDMSVTPMQLRGVGLTGTGLGYFIEEGYDAKQLMRAAVTHRYVLESKSRSVPEDFPAEEMERFWWPISEGITKGALVVRTNEEGQRVAAIVGMSRNNDPDPDGEVRFKPYTMVEVPLD